MKEEVRGDFNRARAVPSMSDWATNSKLTDSRARRAFRSFGNSAARPVRADRLFVVEERQDGDGLPVRLGGAADVHAGGVLFRD